MADDVPQAKPRKLNAKRELFCQLYTKYWNATRAAREAGYTEKNAHVLGYQLLQEPLVQARIQELTEHALKEIGVTRERTLLELSRIAYANMKDLATWTQSGVEYKPSADVGEDSGASIAEVSETVTQVGGTLKIKQHDKVRALELLGRHQRLFADRVEHSGPDGAPIEHKDVTTLTDEQLDARHEALLAKAIAARAGKEEG
jgi:phage terminase small subunit